MSAVDDNQCKTYHQADFKEIGSDAHQNMDLAEEVKVERCHSVIIRDARKEIHEDELAVAFATVAWFFVGRGLFFSAAFYDHNSGGATAGHGCDGLVCVCMEINDEHAL